MNQLGMHVSNEEAKKIVDFYDIYKKGEFNYKVTLASDHLFNTSTLMFGEVLLF